KEQIGFTGTKLPAIKNLTARCFDRLESSLDIRWVLQPETEVGDAAAGSRVLRLFLKHQHVSGARRLHLHKVILLIHWHYSKDALVKFQRTPGIAHCESDMGQSMRSNWHSARLH